MCRLLAGYAWSPEGARLLGRLASLVASAAEYDPYLDRIHDDARHCHGYGFILLSRKGEEGWFAVYERFDAYGGPSDDCSENLEGLRRAASRVGRLLEDAGEAFLIIHARRASRGSPRGTANAHPFAVKAVMRDGVMEFYLAHNGSLEKSSLAASLGVRAEGYTDSHLLALSIAREAELTGEDLSGLLAKHYEHVKTAYNIAVLTLKDSAGRLEPALYLAAGSRDDLGEEVKRYYQHFIFEDSGAAGMASSTVYHLALREGVAGRLGTSFSPAGGGVYRIAPQARGVERLRNL